MNEHGPFIPNRFQPTNDDTKRRDTSLEAWTKLAPLRAALLEAESSDTRSPQMRQDALVAAFAEISAFSTSQIADAIQFSTEAAWEKRPDYFRALLRKLEDPQFTEISDE